MNENLLANQKMIVCINATAAGTSDVDGAVIDMAQDDGYSGIMVVAHLGDVTATAAANLQLMGSAAADGSSPVLENETGALAAAGASDQDNKLVVLDTRCAANRYVFARVKRTTANVVLQSVIAHLYKPRKFPVEQGASVFKAVYDWVLGT